MAAVAARIDVVPPPPERDGVGAGRRVRLCFGDEWGSRRGIEGDYRPRLQAAETSLFRDATRLFGGLVSLVAVLRCLHIATSRAPEHSLPRSGLLPTTRRQPAP